MAVTMTDIAKELNISQSTVSRVINNKDNGRVSEAKATLIRQTAADLGYKVNLAAVGLRTQKSFVIGILLPSPRDSYYGKMVSELQHLISQTPYMATFAFWESEKEGREATNHMLLRQVDAIITCYPKLLPESISVPVVSYCTDDPRFDNITYDYDHSFRLRIEYLMELGHRKIAYIGNFQDSSRQAAFDQLILEKQLSYPWYNKKKLGDYFAGSWTQGIINRFDELWDHDQRPTAVIAQNDSAALLMLRRAWERGIQIPEDLSIIGVDDIPQGAICTPGLNTVNNFGDTSAAKLLMNQVLSRVNGNEQSPQKHVVKGELIIRESCQSV